MGQDSLLVWGEVLALPYGSLSRCAVDLKPGPPPGFSEGSCDPAAVTQERAPPDYLSVKHRFHVSRDQPSSQKSPVACEHGHRLATSCSLFKRNPESSFCTGIICKCCHLFEFATVGSTCLGFSSVLGLGWRLCPSNLMLICWLLHSSHVYSLVRRQIIWSIGIMGLVAGAGSISFRDGNDGILVKVRLFRVTA